MKKYKTAYSYHELKQEVKAAERRGVRMTIETIYAACTRAMLDNGIDQDKVMDCVKTANSILESIAFDNTKISEIYDALEKDHGWVIKFYGE